MNEPDCKETGRVVPVVDRNRCEGKEDCVRVCPCGVLAMRRLERESRLEPSCLEVSRPAWLDLSPHAS